MDIYQTEEEQVEALKKWWEENGKSAIFGVVLGLGAIFGWREWQDYEITQAATASQIYEEMVIAARANDAATMEKRANEITAEYDSTAYGMFARLALARVAADKGEFDAAASELRTALGETSQESIKHVIRLRLARVLASAGNISEAKSVLSQSSDRGEFEVSYLELEGDLARQNSNFDDARNTYQQAITLAQSSGQDTTVLDMKLDDLGRN